MHSFESAQTPSPLQSTENVVKAIGGKKVRDLDTARKTISSVVELVHLGGLSDEKVKGRLVETRERLKKDRKSAESLSDAVVYEIYEANETKDRQAITQAIQAAHILGLTQHNPEFKRLLDAFAKVYQIDTEFEDITSSSQPQNPGRRKFLAGAAAVVGGSLTAGAFRITKGLGETTPEQTPQTLPPPTRAPENTPIPSPTIPPIPTASPTNIPSPTPFPEPSPTAKALPTNEKLPIIPKERRILRPKELTYEQVKRWIGKMNNHDAVLTESLFTRELGQMNPEQRKEIMQLIAVAHADAIIYHYRDTEAIIGLDPGHGGSEIGSSSKGRNEKGETIDLLEKDLTYELANMVAEQIYLKTGGKYTVVILRPQNPIDEDINKDGVISPSERLQKRVALLYETEEKLRPNPSDRGRNIGIVSIHLNGSPNPKERGTEVYWPNKTGMNNEERRNASQKLAEALHIYILNSLLKNSEFRSQVTDRDVKEDPDYRIPPLDIRRQEGPYFILSYLRANWNLESPLN